MTITAKQVISKIQETEELDGELFEEFLRSRIRMHGSELKSRSMEEWIQDWRQWRG